MLDKTDVKKPPRFIDEPTDAELAECAALCLDAGDLKWDYRFKLRLLRERQIAPLQVRLANDATAPREGERRRSGTF